MTWGDLLGDPPYDPEPWPIASSPVESWPSGASALGRPWPLPADMFDDDRTELTPGAERDVLR